MKKIILIILLTTISQISLCQDIQEIKSTVNNIIEGRLYLNNTSPVKFNQEKIFKVAGENKEKAEQRAQSIELNLSDLLKQIKNTKNINNLYIKNKNNTLVTKSNFYLLSITQEDLNSYAMSQEELAEYFITVLNNKIDKAFREYQDNQYRKHSIQKSIITLLVCLLLSGLCLFFQKLFKSKLLFWTMLLSLWIYCASYILSQFPQTRFLQDILESHVLKVYASLLITLWLSTFLIKVSNYFIDKYFNQKTTRQWSSTERKINRINTLEKIIISTTNFIIIITCLILFFVISQVKLISLLAGAGVFSLAAGFLAQDIIRDYINGVLIFIEDQYAVGDIIKIDSHRGEVIDYSLRATKIRNLEGTLITIPHRNISNVENLTNTFSQIDYKIDVDYSTDLDFALRVLQNTVNTLYRDYQELMVETPEMLGVEEFRDSSICLRVLLKTLPSHQWELRRELNLRIKKAFDEYNIVIPFPQRVVHKPS